MSKFVSLSPSGLPEAYDPAIQSARPFVSVKEQDDLIELSYVFPGFYEGELETQVQGDVMKFKEVGMAGASFLSESGKPLLPTIGRFVQIPPGCQYAVQTKVKKPSTLDGYLVTPAQENVTDNATETSEFEYDSDVYSKDELYPAKIVKVSDPQNLDSYKALLVHVRPLQYNASKKQLVAYSNIDVIIHLTRGGTIDDDAEEFGYEPTDPVVDMKGFGNLVLNPRRRIVDRFTELMRQPLERRLCRQWFGPELIIIYDPRLISAANKLAIWKQRKGMLVSVVSIQTVGNSSEKIKDYIRTRRNSRCSRLRYVLLFGDVGAIATEEKFGKTTDHYYYTKNDPVDRHDCVLPWVSGGRIPVDSLSDGTSVVDQIINYERMPPCDREYYRRMTFAAFFQDNSPQDNQADRAYVKTMESIRQHMDFLGFDVQRVYVSNNPTPEKYKDETLVPLDVRNAMVDNDTATGMLISECSEGQLLIGHRDHGSPSGWHRPEFDKHHLESILSPYPSIFYSVNCLTGKFDADPTDSFAEDILEMKGGAPSLIAATELSGTWRNDSLMKALFDAMWPGVIPNYPDSNASYPIRNNRLGDVLNYAKAYLLVAHGEWAGVREHFEMYHVIGDPTIEMWSEEPRTLRVYGRLFRDKLMIHVSPVPTDAMLTIWHRGLLRKRMDIKSPLIILNLRDLLLSSTSRLHPLEICAYAPGHRFAHTRVHLWVPLASETNS